MVALEDMVVAVEVNGIVLVQEEVVVAIQEAEVDRMGGRLEAEALIMQERINQIHKVFVLGMGRY